MSTGGGAAARAVEVNGSKYKSYDIVYILLGRLGLLGRTRLLDLTYGLGRFYRRARLYGVCVTGVDIQRLDWEVPPCEFIQMDAREYAEGVIRGELDPGRVDLVVVDPPWNHEKRNNVSKYSYVSGSLGFSHYHMRGVRSRDIIRAAQRLAGHLGVPLLYRYKEPLPGTTMLVKARLKVFGHTGYVYYGVARGA